MGHWKVLGAYLLAFGLFVALAAPAAAEGWRGQPGQGRGGGAGQYQRGTAASQTNRGMQSAQYARQTTAQARGARSSGYTARRSPSRAGRAGGLDLPITAGGLGSLGLLSLGGGFALRRRIV
jgi:hypothetical protein